MGVIRIFLLGFLRGLTDSLISFVSLIESEQSESTLPSSSDESIGTFESLFIFYCERLLNEYLFTDDLHDFI